MNEQLGNCPRCGCDACYITPINETMSAYYCWGCGFQSSDLLKEGEFDLEEYELSLPELYKDLKSVDQTGRYWFPVTVVLPDKGTVFITGTSVSDAGWAGILVRETTAEEKAKLNDIKYLSDKNTLRRFDSFIDACEYVGVFNLKLD